MTKKIIAIDVDDVLADNALGFTAFSNERWGTTLTIDDYSDYWAQMWGIDEREAEKRAQEFFQSDAMARFSHREEAANVLTVLRRRFELAIVTSRRAIMKQATIDWIRQYYGDIFNEASIHFAGIWDDAAHSIAVQRTKGELCRDLGASYLVDDQLKHCKAVTNFGIKAVLFGDYSWNQSSNLPAGVTRAKSWENVKEYFDHE